MTKLTLTLRWIIVIAAPFFLALLMLQLLIGWNWPSYPEFEYGRIAPDPYGFTREERSMLAEATLAYLRQPEPASEAISQLEAIRLPGTNDPLYNPKEISHMFDVKVVADRFRQFLWILGLILIGGTGFLLLRPETRRQGAAAISQGGIFTSSLLLIIGLFVLLAWNFVFVQFHQLLFPPNSWTFRYSDSLIRLFPEQFWFDFGVLWVGLIFLSGLLLAGVGYLGRKRLSG